MTEVQTTVSPVANEPIPNVRWNFTVNVWDITFITLALSLVSRDTVMPVLVSTLSDSKLAIGLIPAIFTLSYYLPQLLSANFSERMVYKKPFVGTIGLFGERFPYLIIAISLYFYAVRAPSLALVLFYIFWGVAAASAGFTTPAWFDMIAKVISVRRRGIWAGLGHGIGAILSVVVLTSVALPVLAKVNYPMNYVILFLLAFVTCLISYVGFILNREPPSPIVKESVSSGAYFRQLPSVLRRDANYTRFLISRSVIQLATMAGAFYIIFGTEHFHIEATGIVTYTVITVSSVAVMNLLWGVISDRVGHKVVLTLAAFCITLAALVALSAPNPIVLGVTFALIGAYNAADAVSGLNIILEFCAPEDRPTYIGLTNTLLAPVITFAPLIGGLLADAVGFQPVFILTVAVSAVGGLMLLLWVKEPRRLESIEQS